MGSSWTRNWTLVPCSGRWILIHGTTMEVLWCRFLSRFFFPRWLKKICYSNSLLQSKVNQPLYPYSRSFLDFLPIRTPQNTKESSPMPLSFSHFRLVFTKVPKHPTRLHCPYFPACCTNMRRPFTDPREELTDQEKLWHARKHDRSNLWWTWSSCISRIYRDKEAVRSDSWLRVPRCLFSCSWIHHTRGRVRPPPKC